VTRKTPNKLLAQVGQPQVLDYGQVTDAGIVDEHVDGAGFLEDFLHRTLHRGVVANVQFQTLESQLLFARQAIDLLPLRQRTPRRKHAIAALRE
jgi:hypothetical protein